MVLRTTGWRGEDTSGDEYAKAKENERATLCGGLGMLLAMTDMVLCGSFRDKLVHVFHITADERKSETRSVGSGDPHQRTDDPDRIDRQLLFNKISPSERRERRIAR